MKKTLILGATTNENRYAYKAAEQLTKAGHSIIPFGIKKGAVFGREILNEWETFEEVDTVTLYVGPENQTQYFEKIVSIQPKRVIFNPGTENILFQSVLAKANIYFEEACTLVLLSLNKY